MLRMLLDSSKFQLVRRDLIGRRRIVTKNVIKVFALAFGGFVLVAGLIPTLLQIKDSSTVSALAPQDGSPEPVGDTIELAATASTGPSQGLSQGVSEGEGLWDRSVAKIIQRNRGEARRLERSGYLEPPRPKISSSSQVLRREDAKAALPPGTRLFGRLVHDVVAAQSPVPADIEIFRVRLPSGGERFPPSGSVVLAEASFSEEHRRAQVRPIQLVLHSREVFSVQGRGESEDGRIGIQGAIQTERLRNLAGSYLAHFISGASRGAMNQGYFGQSRISNPWTNALVGGAGEVAKEEGRRMATVMQEQITYIEIPKGELVVIRLDQALNWNF